MSHDTLEEHRRKIGINITNARIRAGYKSQRKFAERLSFSHDKLSRIERGESTASIENINEIAVLCNISPELIICINQEKRRSIEKIESILIGNGDINEAEDLIKGLLQQSENELPLNRFNTHLYAGKIYLKRGFYQLALTHFKNALSESFQTKDRHHEFSAKRYISLAYWYLNELDLSLDYIERAAKYVQLEEERFLVLQMEASIFVKQEKRSEALKIYEQLLPIYQSKGLKDNLWKIYHNIADIYCNWQQIDSAINYYQLAYEIEYEIKDIEGICKTLKDLAEIYISQGMLKEARRKLNDAIDFLGQSQPPHLAKLKIMLSRCIENDERKQCLIDAYNILKEIDLLDDYYFVLKSLAEIYEREGDLETSIFYYKEALHSKEKNNQ